MLHLRHLSEEQDAIGRAGVKSQPGGLVPHKLGQKLEDDGGHFRLVCPRLQAAPQRREVGWVQPVVQQACSQKYLSACCDRAVKAWHSPYLNRRAYSILLVQVGNRPTFVLRRSP